MQNIAARKLEQVPKGYLVVGVNPHKKEACGSGHDSGFHYS